MRASDSHFSVWLDHLECYTPCFGVISGQIDHETRPARETKGHNENCRCVARNVACRVELVSRSLESVIGRKLAPETADYQHRIDATGLVCPEPLMIVRNKVREMLPGEVVFVVASDPSTDRDFRDFCRFMGHELLNKTVAGDRFEYHIRKGR